MEDQINGLPYFISGRVDDPPYKPLLSTSRISSSPNMPSAISA